MGPKSLTNCDELYSVQRLAYRLSKYLRISIKMNQIQPPTSQTAPAIFVRDTNTNNYNQQTQITCKLLSHSLLVFLTLVILIFSNQTLANPALKFSSIISSDLAVARFELTRQGRGSGNVVQGACEVQSENALYTVHRRGKPEQVFINKYNLSGPVVQTSYRWTKNGSFALGHQGISVENSVEGVHFWTSASRSYPNGANYVIRFEIKEDENDPQNLLVKNLEYFKVWAGKRGGGSTTPTVSSDGKFLIVKLYDKSTNSITHVRGLSLKALILGGSGDYTDDVYTTFAFSTDKKLITGKGYPLQAMASDGKHIYMVSGFGNNGAPVRLAKYDFQGNLIGYTANLRTGRSMSERDGKGPRTKYEPEGLYISTLNNNQRLALVIASGDKGARVARVWYLGG